MLMLARSVPDSQITWYLASVTYEAFTVSMFIVIWLEVLEELLKSDIFLVWFHPESPLQHDITSHLP